MTNRVLITGGFGYLGGRIAQAISKNPDCIVRLAGRSRQPAPEWLPGAETVALDVLDNGLIAEALKGVDTVIHLAALNEHQCAADPAAAINTNVTGTHNVLAQAAANGIERFIYFSTAHIYGTLVGTITEQSLPRPTHPYAITHYSAENFVAAAHDKQQLTGLVVRLSNGFGAPTHSRVDRWTLLVNDLCRQAVMTGKLVLHSSGLQKRDFITLEDVGRAAVHFLNVPRERCQDGIFNLGGDAVLSVWQMTQLIARRCEAVLGFCPDVIRPAPQPHESASEFRYSVDKIEGTGFGLLGNIEAEVDRFLVFCRASFGA